MYCIQDSDCRRRYKVMHIRSPFKYFVNYSENVQFKSTISIT